MSRQDANAAFALTSFLYGGNAPYIEDLQARYENDPTAVDAEWQEFFAGLKDDRADVLKSANGPSWKRPNSPHANGELIAALTATGARSRSGRRQDQEQGASAASRFPPPTCSRRRATRSAR